MEEFIVEHTTLPKKFVKDFLFITKKSHTDTEIIIDFEIVAKWLEIRKDNLRRVLIANFEKEYDYTEIQLIKSKGGRTNKYLYLLHVLKNFACCRKQKKQNMYENIF